MANSTELRIVKRFPDGQTGDVAVGRINTFGVITIDRVAAGQDASVAQIVAELNATDIAYVKEIAVVEGDPEAAEDADGLPTDPANVMVHSALVKRAFERGSAGFFPALVEMTERFYALELQFDATSLIETIEAGATEAAAQAQAAEDAQAEAMAAEDAALAERIKEAKAAEAAFAEEEEGDGTE